MQNPKSNNYMTWEEALHNARKFAYELEKSGAVYKDKRNYGFNNLPEMVRGAVEYLHKTGELK